MRRWVLALAVAAVVVIALTVHSIVTWTQPASDDHQDISLPQVLGIAVSAILLAVLVVIAVVLRRRGRVERQVRRWRAREDDLDLGP